MSGTVSRENGKTRIEGIPELGWGKNRECTFAGAMEAALSVTDRPTSYNDIMGYTGLAFRVRWYHGKSGDRWCPSSPVGEFPQEMEAIQKAIGWEFRLECLMDQEAPDMSQFKGDIVASVDAGLPVPAYEPTLNMAVIYGYEEGGDRLLLRDYFKEDPLQLEIGELGPLAMFLSEQREAPTRETAISDGLGIASANWERGPMPSAKGSYNYGKAALEAWERDLGFGLSLTGEAKGQLFFVSWWNYSSLYDARRAAAEFLRSSSQALGGGSLTEAAEVYDQEVELLGSSFKNKDAFLGPWSGKQVQDWSEDVVMLEREILMEALEMEEEAIEHIRDALGA